MTCGPGQGKGGYHGLHLADSGHSGRTTAFDPKR